MNTKHRVRLANDQSVVIRTERVKMTRSDGTYFEVSPAVYSTVIEIPLANGSKLVVTDPTDIVVWPQ